MADESITDSPTKSPAKKRKTSSRVRSAAARDPSGTNKEAGNPKSAVEEISAIDALFERASQYAWVAPLLVIAAALITGQIVGFGLGLLVAAGGTLLVVIGLLWASLQGLTENSPLSLEEALSLGAPSVEEEKKRAVLRTLKDLDFERAVGKISEEDYRQLSTRYRAEARDLLRALDSNLGAARDDATALMKAHFLAEGIEIPKTADKTDDDEQDGEDPALGDPRDDLDNDDLDDDDDELESEEDLAPGRDEAGTSDDQPVPGGWLSAGSSAAEPVDDPVEPPPQPRSGTQCASCNTLNDDDARFCKGCGAVMEEP